MDTAYAVPLAFRARARRSRDARRARSNLRWLQLREGGTGVATVAVLVAAVALCLALVAALSIGFYGLFVLYQHSR